MRVPIDQKTANPRVPRIKPGGPPEDDEPKGISPDRAGDGAIRPGLALATSRQGAAPVVDPRSQAPRERAVADRVAPSVQGTPTHSLSAQAAARAIAGFVDGLDPTGAITGWAYLPDAPSLRLKVSVWEGEEFVVASLANMRRAEGRGAPGHGDESCGFALPLPRRLFDDQLHTLLVRCDVPETEAFVASPFIIEVQAELSAAALTEAGSAATLAALPFVPPARGPERPAETYIPGQYVICRAAFPKPVYHTSGWHDPEPDFTWIAGIEAVIEMAIRRPPHAYTFILDVMPNGVGDRPQTLQVFVNYLCVGLFEVTDPQTITVALPSDVFFLRKTRINLHCRQAVVGTEFGVPDARRLGIAVRSWCIG
jgi:hypothetical protein